MVDEHQKPHVIIDEQSFYLEIRKIDETTMRFIGTWFESIKITRQEPVPQLDYDDAKTEITSPKITGEPILNVRGTDDLKHSEKTFKKPYAKKYHDSTFRDEHGNKHCSKCDKTKPLSDFNKSKHARTGHQSSCRECQRKQSMEWKLKHMDTGKQEPGTEQKNSGVEPEKQPEPSIKTEPKKTLGWTKERDKIICDNFRELGVSGIYDKSLLPGFSLSEIRHRCQKLKLIDQYGNIVMEN